MSKARILIYFCTLLLIAGIFLIPGSPRIPEEVTKRLDAESKAITELGPVRVIEVLTQKKDDSGVPSEVLVESQDGKRLKARDPKGSAQVGEVWQLSTVRTRTTVMAVLRERVPQE